MERVESMNPLFLAAAAVVYSMNATGHTVEFAYDDTPRAMFVKENIERNWASPRLYDGHKYAAQQQYKQRMMGRVVFVERYDLWPMPQYRMSPAHQWQQVPQWVFRESVNPVYFARWLMDERTITVRERRKSTVETDYIPAGMISGADVMRIPIVPPDEVFRMVF